MKNNIKSLLTILAATAMCGVAGAQNTTEMKKDTLKTAMQNIENGVVKGYKAIENGVVGGYTTIQDGVVEGFTAVSDAFIMKFFAHKGETLEQAKERMKAAEAELHRQNQERVAASRQRSEEHKKATK